MSSAEKDAKKSRAAVIGAAGLPIPMPDADHQLIDVLAEMGWCQSGGWGPIPLSATEIAAWCDGMGEALTPWEFSMIRRMSAAFVSGSNAECAPYQPMIVRMAMVTAAVG